MRRILFFCVLAGVGCASPDEGPRWAFDPIYAEPTADGGLHGFQTWQFYSEAWSRRFSQRHYLCSLVVELFGSPLSDADCPGCGAAWSTDAYLLETDCPASWVEEEPLFTSLERLGLGDLDGRLGEADPYPGVSQGGWAHFGADWEIHGWAYPSSAETEATPAWDQQTQLTFWPALAWDLAALN